MRDPWEVIVQFNLVQVRSLEDMGRSVESREADQAQGAVPAKMAGSEACSLTEETSKRFPYQRLGRLTKRRKTRPRKVAIGEGGRPGS